MDFNTFKNLVIAKCEELGITEYELYYQAAESTSIAAFQHEINQFTSSIEGGVCFRCIVNGKICEPVRGASLVGKGSEVIQNIDMVGTDLDMGQGMCGSSSGSVPTNVGQPMIRVSSITVGGR